MTLIEQVKILDDIIKANKARYDLDREAAKISALSSGKLRKFEYLTGEDLGYIPYIIQKGKLKRKCSPLGKVFHKGLDKSHKKEGLLKRLKIIEGKNEQQLLAIKNQGKKQSETIEDRKEEQLDALSDQEGITIDNKNRVKSKSIFETIAEVNKSKNAKDEAQKLEKIDKLINYNKLSITDKNAK